MENKDRAGSLTASPWIKRESPERRAHAASRESSASPSRNAVVVESVVEIDIPRKASARKSARRGTSVDEEYEKITKVTGKQFIPAGEVELEPMPLLDEFEFSSNYFQTIFLEDQRRTKEIRRKQYGDRNYDKVKDFVMYRYEALRSEASQILKNHYSQHGRPMTKKEISDAATQLKVEDTIFQRIHDDYRAWWIKNRRQIRAQRGRVYIYHRI